MDLTYGFLPIYLISSVHYALETLILVNCDYHFTEVSTRKVHLYDLEHNYINQSTT